MPIFNNEYTFIHIPKSGGTSVEFFMGECGKRMSLYSDNGSVFINGHTPQHCTFRELNDLGVLTDKIFTVLRPDVERTISEYFWLRERKAEVIRFFSNFDEFLDLFLNKENSHLFDNHNLPNSDFLIDKSGRIDSRIKIFNYFDSQAIEQYLGMTGLGNHHHFKTQKNEEISERQRKRIMDFYSAGLKT